MPHTWPSPPTDNEVMLYRYRKGGVIAREIVASRTQAPPTFCTEAKVAKGGGGGGGGLIAGHYGKWERLSSPRSMLRYVILLNIHDGDRL